jgi:hypothetical protein
MKKQIEIQLPPGATIQKNGRYLRLALTDESGPHPLAGRARFIPYHRFVCFESLGRPLSSPCHWCGHVLPWKTTIMGYQASVVNVDHLDADTTNNDPDNLVPSCAWCNANRVWAEDYPDFWEKWRSWLKDTPPQFRPNLPIIARDFGIVLDLSKSES